MTLGYQASLFDTLIDDTDARAVAPGSGDVRRTDASPSGSGFADLAGAERIELGAGAWLDVLPGWAAASDGLFRDLARDVPWQADRRQMYDRVVDVPRLVRHYDEHDALPHPRLAEAMAALNTHYAARGAPAHQRFRRAGLCLYRDGRDSIAWHGDRVGRTIDRDTMVGILSLGQARMLAIRPKGGGTVRRFPAGHGDLLVMGGSCQRTHEHSISKTTTAAGTRISVQFRPVWPT